MVSETAVTAIALGTFALLFVRRAGRYPLTRPVTACTGAVALLGVGALSPAAALAAVDVDTLLLLFGMLVHVEALSRSGFYGWAAARLVRWATTTRRLALGALVLAAALSAVALNDAVVLLLTPVLVRAVAQAEVDPAGPLVAVVLGANVGSTATPLGNPQNAYVLSESGLTTVEFVTVLGPVALVALAATGAMLALRLDAAPVDAAVRVPAFGRGWALASGGFVAATFLALALAPGTSAGVLAAGVAVVHVAWLQLFRRVPGDEVLGDLDWGILVLFVGLFVLVGALDGTPLVALLRGVDDGWALAGTTFLLSNLVSNVPAVVLLSAGVSDPQWWYVLAAVGTLAGNATPVASAATLIVLDTASREGVDLSPVRLVAVGLPVAVVTSALGAALVLV